MTQSAKSIIINRVIYWGYFFSVFVITAYVWHYLLLDPWLAILGLTDQIENYGRWAGNLIQIAPSVPLVIIGIVIHEKVVKKFYRYDE